MIVAMLVISDGPIILGLVKNASANCIRIPEHQILLLLNKSDVIQLRSFLLLLGLVPFF